MRIITAVASLAMLDGSKEAAGFVVGRGRGTLRHHQLMSSSQHRLLQHDAAKTTASFAIKQASHQTMATSSSSSSSNKPQQVLAVLLPLNSPWSVKVQVYLDSVLREIVDKDCSTGSIFVSTATRTPVAADDTTALSLSSSSNNDQWQWTCSVPAFGDDCRIQLKLLYSSSCSSADDANDALVLSLTGSSSTLDTDFAWICTKFYESKLCSLGNHHKDDNAVVDCGGLRNVIVQHYNQRPAHPGLDASSAAWTEQQTTAFEERILGDSDISTVLERLEEQGYVVIDQPNEADTTESSSSFSLATTAAQQEMLSAYYLHETTGQGDSVRTDHVHFLSRDEAVACDIQPQYDFLMGIASYLNEHQDHAILPASDFMQAIPPATFEKPLTIPESLQFAEYGPGDFYAVRSCLRTRASRVRPVGNNTFSHTHTYDLFSQAHSDNSVTAEFTRSNESIRANFRA